MSMRTTNKAFCIALFCAIPFLAQAADEPRSYQIHFDDLNLSTESGTKALYRRINSAAQLVCQDFESRSLERQALHARCQADAIGDAVARIHHPQLTAYYSALNRGRAPMVISQTSSPSGRVLVSR